KKGIEVLLLTDRVDEWMLTYLRDFEGKSLVSIAKGDLDLGGMADEEEKKHQEEVADAVKPLVDRLKASLGERVKDVRVTFRLVNSPACVVSDEQDLSQNLQRLLKSAGQPAPVSKPILEINPEHPLVTRIKETDEASFGEWSQLL